MKSLFRREDGIIDFVSDCCIGLRRRSLHWGGEWQVDMAEDGDSVTLRRRHGVEPWESTGPSSGYVWWSDAGVHQDITFAAHPDPVSGMRCWHQKVRVRPALDEDRCADIHVDHALVRRERVRVELRLDRPKEPDGAMQLARGGTRKGEPLALDISRARTEAFRVAARARVQTADQIAELVDWDPASVSGALGQSG